MDEFNRQSAAAIAHIRGFIILHYHVTERRDTPFWRACAEMDIPASLRHRIDLFRETGRVFHLSNELFTENSWIQVMLGQGIHPEQQHQSADLMGRCRTGRLSWPDQGVDRPDRAALASAPGYVRHYCGA